MQFLVLNFISCFQRVKIKIFLQISIKRGKTRLRYHIGIDVGNKIEREKSVKEKAKTKALPTSRIGYL